MKHNTLRNWTLSGSLAIALVTGFYLTTNQAASSEGKLAPQPKLANEGQWQRPSDETLKETLTSLQFSVTQKSATERPFENEYWDNKEKGIYVDIASGEPLFSSQDKFKSGTGWPSFTRPLVNNHVVEKVDSSWGIRRTEVRSNYADSHLGHLFSDGPAPTGLRYCINSASLRFIPKDNLVSEGYSQFLTQLQ